MIRITICGVMGKVGLRIANLSIGDPEFEISGAIEFSEHPQLGKDIGSLLGLGTLGVNLSSDLDKLISKTDCIIDFSSPSATVINTRIAASGGKPIVIGTTGLSESDMNEIKLSAAKIPIVLAPNMGVGMNVMFRLASEMAKFMPEYDMEIVEVHHKLKKDAPSGTAIRLGQVITEALGKNFDDVACFSRHGRNMARSQGELGIQSIRAGDVVGEHTLIFAGPGERLELTHRAHSRDNFARGSLIAAKWLVRQKPGLYDMQDVLGLKG